MHGQPAFKKKLKTDHF